MKFFNYIFLCTLTVLIVNCKVSQNNRKGSITLNLQQAEVSIGDQIWMRKNLNVVTFRNGDTIPRARTHEEWVLASKSNTPAWCYYHNDSINGDKYGKLYNWHAVNDTRQIAPEGWHIPTKEEFTTLVNFVGGDNKGAFALKSKDEWIDTSGITNVSGYGGKPGGYRYRNGLFCNQFKSVVWWTSSEERYSVTWGDTTELAAAFPLNKGSHSMISSFDQDYGCYIRCIKNTTNTN